MLNMMMMIFQWRGRVDDEYDDDDVEENLNYLNAELRELQQHKKFLPNYVAKVSHAL